MSRESLIPENLSKDEKVKFYKEMAEIGNKYFKDNKKPTIKEFNFMVSDLIEKEINNLFDTGGLKLKIESLAAANTLEIKLLVKDDFLIDVYHLVDGEICNITNYGILTGESIANQIKLRMYNVR